MHFKYSTTTGAMLRLSSDKAALNWCVAINLRQIQYIVSSLNTPVFGRSSTNAGSDRILSSMRRGYSFSEYLEKIDILRSEAPGCSITTDIIVGFPGESDDDFKSTLTALEQIRFDQIFSFKFSPRPGTKAEHMADQIPEDVKKGRLAEVHTIQDKITQGYHKQLEGSVVEVLLEGHGRQNQLYGRTRTNKIVNFDDNAGYPVGAIVHVKILRGLNHSLFGEIAY